MCMQAKILEIQLQGFRKFSQPRRVALRGPAGAPLNSLVVAGPNGQGKTSLLEAILFVLGRESLVHSELSPELHDRWWRSAISASTRIELQLHVASAPGTLLATRTPCDVQLVRTQKRWTLWIDDPKVVLTEDPEAIQTLLEALPIEYFSSWRELCLPGSILPLAPIPDTLRGEARRLWRLKKDLIDERTRSAIRGAPSKDGHWLKALNTQWQRLHSDETTILALDQWDALESGFDLCLKRHDPELGELFLCTVDQLSSGELEWLVMLGGLIIRDFNGVLLIDEPELHMHPEWQRLLLPVLHSVAPNAQVILTSHADAPWDQVYSFERLLLVEEGDPRREETQ